MYIGQFGALAICTALLALLHGVVGSSPSADSGASCSLTAAQLIVADMQAILKESTQANEYLKEDASQAVFVKVKELLNGNKCSDDGLKKAKEGFCKTIADKGLKKEDEISKLCS